MVKFLFFYFISSSLYLSEFPHLLMLPFYIFQSYCGSFFFFSTLCFGFSQGFGVANLLRLISILNCKLWCLPFRQEFLYLCTLKTVDDLLGMWVYIWREDL